FLPPHKPLNIMSLDDVVEVSNIFFGDHQCKLGPIGAKRRNPHIRYDYRSDASLHHIEQPNAAGGARSTWTEDIFRPLSYRPVVILPWTSLFGESGLKMIVGRGVNHHDILFSFEIAQSKQPLSNWMTSSAHEGKQQALGSRPCLIRRRTNVRISQLMHP